MEFIKIKNTEIIENAVIEFCQCFPHLKEKIGNIHKYAEKLDEFAEVYILLDNGIRKGISVFYDNDKQNCFGYISLIGIKEQYRKQNLGGITIDFTHEIMRKNGMKYCKLEVDKDNKNAYDFYIHKGYEFCEPASDTSIYLLKKL